MMPAAADLSLLTSDRRQIAAVRRIVLDDGPERGVRMLAFSNGGGLDFWVAIDRSMDIGLLSWRGQQMGWQSPAGMISPALVSPGQDDGSGFSRSFGGFLNTCGLDHIRQPVAGRPLHGHLPHTPARLTSYGEDWSSGIPVLYCEGEMVLWRYGGEGFRLRRRIETAVGSAALRLIDRVENIGPDPMPVLVLYHFNLGYPAICDGTNLFLDGRAILGPLSMPDPSAVGPSQVHPCDGASARCSVESPVEGGTRRIIFDFDSATLPFLQLWRDLRPRCGVLSVEPCNIGKAADGSNDRAMPLHPGETVTYRIDVSIEDTGASRPRQAA